MTVTPGNEIEFADLPGRSSADPLNDVHAQSSLRIARPERTHSRLAHRHPHSEEIIYVRQGTGAVFIDGVFYRIEPGATVHVPAGAAHATVPDIDQDMELVCFFPHPELAENIEETDIDVMKEIQDG